MSKKIAIDLFTGSGTFEKVARSFNYEVISLDNRRRKGVCEPTLKLDILEVPGTFFKSLDPYIIWCGLPCDIWSLASGGFHLDKNYQALTVKAKLHLQIYKKTIQIIEESSPTYFFIENPRGKLHKYPDLLERCQNLNWHIFECTLSSYGFPTKKPTVIITNYPGLKLKPLDSFGRGAKNKVLRTFDNMTKTQRQKTPPALIKDILRQI